MSKKRSVKKTSPSPKKVRFSPIKKASSSSKKVTVKELKDELKKLGIKGYSLMNKSQLENLLQKTLSQKKLPLLKNRHNKKSHT